MREAKENRAKKRRFEMLFSYDVFSHSVFLNITRGAVLEGPEKFSHPESRSKILNLMIKELFYSHVLNTIRSSIPYKKFQAYTPLCFKYRLTNWIFGPEKLPCLSRNMSLVEMDAYLCSEITLTRSPTGH